MVTVDLIIVAGDAVADARLRTPTNRSITTQSDQALDQQQEKTDHQLAESL